MMEEELRLELSEKNEQLQMAAEMGQQLVQQNQELEQEILQLRSRVESRDAEIAALTEQLRSVKEEKSLLEGFASKAEHHTTEADEDQVRSSSEYKNLQARYELLREQVEEAAEANRTLLDEVRAKDSALERFKNQEKDLVDTRNKFKDTVAELAATRASLAETQEKINNIQREAQQYKVQAKKAQEAVTSMEGDVSELQQKLSSKDVPSKRKIAELQSRLEEVEAQLQEAEQNLNDSRWENKKLEESVMSMTMQLSRVHREGEEHLKFLEEARAALSQYRLKEEEKSLQENVNMQDRPAEEEPTRSLLSELEKEFETRIVQKKQTKKPVDAPENCEEFFYLAATAVKISMAINNPQTSDGCFRVNPRSLYHQCLDAEVPFHEWYEWIKLQMRSKAKALRSSVTRDVDDPVNKAVPYGVSPDRANPPPSAPLPSQMPSPKKKFNFSSLFS